ncbi:hypothetical protein BC828DRAFT_378924 [Blastocladiella britannica]|nr:hypothetical protein BC828DRAFT_378924 [Blastocladiella britannica]
MSNFTITNFDLIWSNESVTLGVILYLNIVTFISATWVNWTQGAKSNLISGLAVLALIQSADYILLGVRTALPSDSGSAVAIAIVQNVLEWSFYLGFLLVNYSRLVTTAVNDTALPSTTMLALKAAVMFDFVACTLIFIGQIALDAAGQYVPELMAVTRAYGLYNAILNLIISWLFARQISSVPAPPSVVLEPPEVATTTSLETRLSATRAGTAIVKVLSSSVIRHIQVFLAIQCLWMVVSNLVQLVAPNLDPNATFIVFGEAVRLYGFNWYFTEIHILELDGLISTVSQAGGGSKPLHGLRNQLMSTISQPGGGGSPRSPSPSPNSVNQPPQEKKTGLMASMVRDAILRTVSDRPHPDSS